MRQSYCVLLPGCSLEVLILFIFIDFSSFLEVEVKYIFLTELTLYQVSTPFLMGLAQSERKIISNWPKQ